MGMYDAIECPTYDLPQSLIFTFTLNYIFVMLSLILSLTAFYFSVVAAVHLPSFDYSGQNQVKLTPDKKVLVQLGVMSRCPDALLCESVFNEVLDRVPDKVNLSLVYVATYVRR